MKFRDATDRLFDCVSHADLAAKLGISIASIRQARLKPEAKSNRPPPEGWEQAVAQLAAEQIHQYQRLINELSLAAQQPLFPERENQ